MPDCHLSGRPFLAELSSDGVKLLMTTGLSGMGFDQLYAMAFDTAHSVVYLAGDVESTVFFATPSAAQASFGGGDTDAFVSRVDLTLQPTVAASCVVNSASYFAGNTGSFPTGAVAPGEIVSLFGVGLGPAAGVSLQLTGAGTVSTSLGGTQVLFDGVPAPLLYAANGQVNAVVPFSVKAPSTAMTVQRGASTAGPVPMPVVDAVPAIFLCGLACADASQAAALNSDYSLNTVSNPAARGDYITLFACGAGLMSSNVDGAVTPQLPPYPLPQLPVTATIRGVAAQVLYAGAAPGFVSGALQVNIRIPAGIDFGSHVPVSIQVGSFTSQTNVTIAVK